MLVQLGAEFNGTIWKWPTRPSIHSVSAFAGTTHRTRGYLAMLRILTHVVSSFVGCPLMALNGHSNRAPVCPLSDNSGQTWILAWDGLSANDPTATLAVHCGNGFDAGFSPYQSARLN